MKSFKIYIAVSYVIMTALVFFSQHCGNLGFGCTCPVIDHAQMLNLSVASVVGIVFSIPCAVVGKITEKIWISVFERK